MVDAGQPFGAIVDCAEKKESTLIVMSSHGRSGLSRMLIGSVTDKILRGGSVRVGRAGKNGKLATLQEPFILAGDFLERLS